MVPELRKRHRQIWQIGSLVLLLGFMGAVRVLPKPAEPVQWEGPSPEIFGNVLTSKQGEGLVVQLRQHENGQKQFTILPNILSGVPLLTVQCNQHYLGTLGPRSSGAFTLDDSLVTQTPYHLELIDPLNHKVIFKAEFP